MDPAEMDDVQLNRHIADRKAVAALAKQEMEEALGEWRSRHGEAVGTERVLGGVTVRLEMASRWDEEQAWRVLADRQEVIEVISRRVLDRTKAKKVLDEQTYALCQKVSDKPRVRIFVGEMP